MSVKLAGLLLGIAMLGLLAFGLWYQGRYPRQIISSGTVRVDSIARPGAARTLETRRIRVGSNEFEEVRMPNGTWIGCAGDCRKAALDAGPDFWDAINRNSGR